MYSSLLKKKKKLKFNNLFTFLTGISDNYIMIKTAPSRHTDHASEREPYKRHTVPASTHTHTPQSTINPIHSFLPVHSDIGLLCKHWQTAFAILFNSSKI